MPKPRKVGGQIKGGKTTLGRLGQKGTKGRAGTGASKKRLGSSAMTKRNVGKLDARNSRNLRRKAHGP